MVSGDDMAARLVDRVVPKTIPRMVRDKLAIVVRAIVADGDYETDVIEEALEAWVSRPSVAPGFLPYLLCDVVKARSRFDVRRVMRAAWKTGDVSQLEPFGYVWVCPPIPPGIVDVDDIRSHMLCAKREWIEQLERALPQKVAQ